MSFVLFSSTTNVLQFAGILIAAFLVSVVSQLIYKKFSDQLKIGELNSRMKDIRKEMRNLKDPDKLMALNTEMLKNNSDKMRLVMKPMMISSMMFIGAFYLWGKLFKGFNLFIFSSSLPLIGADVGWLLTYILASLVLSVVVRKKMGVQL